MKLRLSCFFLVVLAVLLAGCGGGGTPPGTASTAVGRATITFTWPARTRLIPVAANSIMVTLTQGAVTVASQVVTRPATGSTATVTFNSVPAGTVNVTATAYPNADGTGTAQATATTSIVVQANQNTPFSLTMGSTIDHLVSSPASIAIGVGDVAAVTVTAMDASGNTVLIKPQTLKWLSSNPTVATVDGMGNVTGVAPGGSASTVQITITENESGKSVSIPVVVVASVLTAYEPFNYNSPGGFLGPLNGGTGWGFPWSLGGLLVSSDNLTYGNLVTSGHCAVVDPRSFPFDAGDTRILASPLGTPGTVIYFSCLLRPTDPIGSSNASNYCGFSIDGLFIGKTGKGNYYGMTTGYLIGANYVGSQVMAQQNTTVFLVVRATFKAGNDQFDLWVNPVPGQPLPTTPDATKTDLDLGTPGPGTLTTIGLHGSMNAEFDELRIGTSYAAVAPTQ